MDQENGNQRRRQLLPMDGLVVKAEYQIRKLNSPYNNEPTLSIGVAYAGLFGK